MDYYELHSYMSLEASDVFKANYRWDLSWDMQMDAAGRGWNDPKKTIKSSIRGYLKRHPEEYNPIFEPFFTEDEIKDMSQSLREAV